MTDELGSEAAGSFFFGEHVLLPRKAAIKITHTGPTYTKQTAIKGNPEEPGEDTQNNEDRKSTRRRSGIIRNREHRKRA